MWWSKKEPEPPKPVYYFKPDQDITLMELAIIVKMLLRYTPMQEYTYRELSSTLKRHFKRG